MKRNGGNSRYKLIRIATESLRNSLRLLFDAVLLFDNGSYPSVFQLSVLSLEEFAKARWVEHYVWTPETNEGYPDQKFEQSWLKLLYLHPEKQMAYIAREIFEYSPKFADFIEKRGLEEKKQNAVYVGLSRSKGTVDTTSRISTPARIKKRDASQMISLTGSEFIDICRRIELDEMYFEIEQLDEVFDYQIYRKLLKWPQRTGLKSRRWSKIWFEST